QEVLGFLNLFFQCIRHLLLYFFTQLILLYSISLCHIPTLLYFFCNPQLGTARPVVLFHFIFRSNDCFSTDHFKWFDLVTKEILLHFSLELSFGHEILHQPVFQRMVRHHYQTTFWLQDQGGLLQELLQRSEEHTS